METEMQTRYGLPLVLAALLAGAGAVPAQTLDYWGEAGGWDVLIDPSLGNGCLIQAEYDNGVTVRIGFDMVQEMGYVTAFNEAWGDIVEGQSYPVAFDLDGEQYEGEAVGLYLNGVPGADILFDSTDFLWDIAAKQTMTLYNENGEVMTIDLTGTMVGLDAALQCQGENG
jgi:hypothetical protein